MRETPAILIIDDNEEELQMYVSKLSEGNFVIFTAQDGSEGIDIAREEQPDLILVDLSMPGVNGLDTVFQLKDDATTLMIPFVFLVDSNDAPEDVTAARASNAAALLNKQEDVELLVERLQEILSLLPARPE